MALYDITTGSIAVDFGATGTSEILQNLRMILATPEFSCPLNREFAWRPEVDAPINIAKAKITAKLVESLEKYEPRATLIEVLFDEDLENGVLKPRVRVEIDE